MTIYTSGREMRTMGIVPLLIALASGEFLVRETDLGKGQVAHITTNSRLGVLPGVDASFIISFHPLATSTVSVNNKLRSTRWSENGTVVRDAVVTPTTALQATFEYVPTAHSTLAFYEMAKVVSTGAYVCGSRVGLGKMPPKCTSRASAIDATCTNNVCSFETVVSGSKNARIEIQPSATRQKCTRNITISTIDEKLCVTPTRWILRTGGEPTRVYSVGIGEDARTAFWTDGTRARLYVGDKEEDPVEQAIIIIAAILILVLWCEQTLGITAYAVNTALVSHLAPAMLKKRVSVPEGVEELFDQSSIMPLIYADTASSLAFSATLYAYKYGPSILSEPVARLYPGYATAAQCVHVAFMWFAAGVLWIVLVAHKKSARVKTIIEAHPSKSAAMLLCRSVLEVSIITAVHLHFPRSHLGEYADLVGFFFGISVVLIVTRDLYLSVKIGVTHITAALAVVWAATTQHAAMIMVFPVAYTSTAVLSYSNGAVVYSATLTIQAAVAGVIVARRKLKPLPP